MEELSAEQSRWLATQKAEASPPVYSPICYDNNAQVKKPREA